MQGAAVLGKSGQMCSVDCAAMRAVALLTLAGACAYYKSLPLYNDVRPYSALREFIREHQTWELIGWSANARPRELQIMQAEVPTLQRVAWVDALPQVVEQCRAFPHAVFMVSGAALPPPGLELRLAAQFDDPADQFVPGLLESGVDRVELQRAGYDLPVSGFGSRLHAALHTPGLGIRLYDFVGCGD